MPNIQDILSNWFVKNLLLAVLALLGITLLVNISLAIITQHNKEIVVPDLSNMSIAEASSAAKAAGVRVEVIDSVYHRHVKKGVVFTQIPVAGSKVKQDRRILLTMVAFGSQKVTMPSLVGYSMRQAKAELNSKGLVLGRLIYVRDMATNNVLRQLYKNNEIMPGKTIDAGSKIDLVVGLSSDDSYTFVPNVVSLKYERAIDLVRDNSLNLGRISFDSTVRSYSDSLNARVVRQIPESDGFSVPMGSEVSLVFSMPKQ